MTRYLIGKARVGYWIYDDDAPWYTKNFRASVQANRFARRRDAEREIAKRNKAAADKQEDK